MHPLRASLLALLALAALAAAPAVPGDGLGGAILLGAGVGTFQNNNQTQTCAGSPFSVQVVYWPGDEASLASEPAVSCPGTVAATLILGGVAVNSTQNPPLRLVFFCQGSEAAGLQCQGMAGNTTITAQVGPSAGPGSTVSFQSRGAYRFDGSFTAV